MDEIEPLLFVVFGATGDLARHKLMPSLFEVAAREHVGRRLHVLAVSLDELDDSGYRAWVEQALAEAGAEGDVARWCDDCIRYTPAGSDYAELRRLVEEIEADEDLPGNRIFYLALPPQAFDGVIAGLGAAGLGTGPGFTRLVIEKPFGTDLASAEALNEAIHTHFEESQVYRIDHYLGKETVQNLLAFRFANLVFESNWHRDRIDSIEITVAESIGAEGRASYYDSAGVLRDVVQNHVAQLLSLVAMEAPHTFRADAIRDEKVQALSAVRPIDLDSVVVGQYTDGVIDGEAVPGYRDSPGVADDSQTPTFVAMRIGIDNWRWEGVPIFIRSGKRMAEKATEIAVRFKAPPVHLFGGDDAQMPDPHKNVLVLVLQPGEGFELHFDVKAPGDMKKLVTQTLEFDYADAFSAIPDAYQTLLLDVMQGDQTLFVRADEVEASWRLFDPVICAGLPVLPYRAGTWGPDVTEERLDKKHGWVLSHSRSQ